MESKTAVVTNYTKKVLDGFNATNLIKIANEELGLTLAEGLTKGQKIQAILDTQNKAHGVADIVPANAEEVKAIIKPITKAAKANAVELKTIAVGDTFVYASNKQQPYKVDAVRHDEKLPLGVEVTITNMVTGKVWNCTKPRDLELYKVIRTKDLAEQVKDAPKELAESFAKGQEGPKAEVALKEKAIKVVTAEKKVKK